MAQDKHEERQTNYGQHGHQPMERKASRLAGMRASFHSNPRLRALSVIVLAAAIAVATAAGVKAETNPGTSIDNGLTSRILSLSNTLTGLGYGSTTNTPDWGTLWNRISTAAQYTPSGNAAVSDVKSGKTFNSNSRTQQTGTYPAPSSCATQAYHDSFGAPVTTTTNCSLTWTTASPAVTGDDKQDPRTGMTWSLYLANSSGTPTFVSSGGSTWSWDATGASNVAVGNKTAIQVCSGMNGGGVWRLPTQKELMQAYIDGSYFNLTNPSNNFWSATQYSSTNAWSVALNGGSTGGSTNGTLASVRCVR